MSYDLRNGVAIIAGASKLKSIGAAVAQLLANQGCNILINCLKNKDQAAKIIELCRSYGVDAELFMGDLTDVTTCESMAGLAKTRWGRTDIIVNCVGATKNVGYEQLDQLNKEDFLSLYATNTIAPYLMAQAFSSLLKSSPYASIINITSAAGITGKGSSIAYAVAKGATNTLTLALAQALSPEVRVNAVCPSFVDSSWWEKIYTNNPDKYRDMVSNMAQNNLLGKVVNPNDVANMVLSIINNPSITGELIRLDSGSHIGRANPR